MMTPERRALLAHVLQRLSPDPVTGRRALSIRRTARLAGVSTATVLKYAKTDPASRKRFQATEIGKLLRALESIPS